MNIYYKNNLKNSFLVIESEEEQQLDFQGRMLQFNDIPGLVRTSIKNIDNKSHYYYDVSGKVSLQSIYEKEKMSKKQIKDLVDAILCTMKNVQKYMLDGTGILLEPEYIYCEYDTYYFCYYPDCKQNIKEEFHKLTEFFVREVDYKDKEGVHLAYTLHKETMEENYSIEKIMERISEEEEKTKVEYERKTTKQTEANIVIAEKKELWEPVRKLLERTKKDKWGKWEGL